MLFALHTGQPLRPHDVAGAWSFAAGVVLGLMLPALSYAYGWWRISRRVNTARGVSDWQAAAFCAGWLLLAIALVSPLHALGTVLFSAHMVQHELMIVLAAPLLVLGRPLVPMIWALPLRARRGLGMITRTRVVQRVWRTLTMPVVAWTLHALVLWGWHLPGLYGRTLTSELMHTLQHVSFLGSALLFWWALLHGRERRLGYGAAVVYLFTTALHTGALGALLTFAAAPWYVAYEGLAAPFGLTTLQDQQLAGLIMWIPPSIAYLIAALALVVAWLRESERRVLRWQQRAAVTHG